MTQKRPHWYDFQKVTTNDLQAEQDAWLNAVAEATDGSSGTGIQLEQTIDRVIFDTSALSLTQSAWVSTGVFDGRGILPEAYVCSDRAEGNQISVRVSDSRATEFLPIICTVLGTDFNDNIYYEHIRCPADGLYQTYGHFKVVENILFQNVFGNTDARIDGYGSFNLAGRVVVAEASSFLPAADTIVANQSRTPDIIFSKYKLYNSGNNLEQILDEALRFAYSVDDLGVNTTVSETKVFSQGGSSEIIYAQKFRMRGNNIQKVQLLLALDSGASWTGSISVGVKRLLNSETFSCSTRYLPDTLIDFDPETEYIAEVALDQAGMAEQGVELGPEHQPVDFVFSETSIGNANLSTLEDDAWYALTVRRTGSAAIGTVSIPVVPIYTGIDPYTKREDEDFQSGAGRFTIFSSGIWTDVKDRTTWYRICGDAFRTASGVAVDEGARIKSPKTFVNDKALRTQYAERGVSFADSSTDVDNYLVVQSAAELLDFVTHPATGDRQASREIDTPELSSLRLSEVEDLIRNKPNLVVAASGADTNPRANPVITGTVYYPGLFRNNILDIPNPAADLINYNVVGSIITPNTLKPSLRYRIVSQQFTVDGYGDIDSDGEITVSDLAEQQALLGYSVNLATTGTRTAASQQADIANESVNLVDILKANLNTDTEITSADVAALNDFLNAGTGFPNGQGQFNRVRLVVEPLLGRIEYLDTNGNSNLAVHDIDTDLLSTFSAPVSFSIAPVRVWRESGVQITDLRRFVISAATAFTPADLSANPPTGGQNNLIAPGDIYLTGNILNPDGSHHRLDYERALVELELPDGDSEKEINIFDVFVKNRMRFSDGTLVTTQALAGGQVTFEVQVSSFAKNLGFATDGYVDYDGVGDSADEAVGTYIDHDTGLLRVRAYNIVNNDIRPEVRTRIYVIVNLKKAGWRNSPRVVSSTELAALW